MIAMSRSRRRGRSDSGRRGTVERRHRRQSPTAATSALLALEVVTPKASPARLSAKRSRAEGAIQRFARADENRPLRSLRQKRSPSWGSPRRYTSWSMGLSTARSPRVVGRYALYSEIAAGGMAAVYFGRLLGPAGIQRTVAVKQLHPQCWRGADFVAQFLDEARITARISHGNVVQTLDIIADDQQLLIVMEYVHGETLARMLRSAQEQHYRL